MELTLPRAIQDIEAGAANPLDRVTHAVQAGRELEALADAVVDHFVGEARRSGCSWAQIGGALNISKQAAQQRFGSVPQPFERFSEEVKRVLERAPELATAHGHTYIATEHLLEALMQEEESRAARILVALGVTPQAVAARLHSVDRSQVKAVAASPDGGPLPTHNLKKVIEQAFREAQEVGSDHVETQHLLLAVVNAGPASGVAGAVLTELGVTGQKVQEQLDEST